MDIDSSKLRAFADAVDALGRMRFRVDDMSEVDPRVRVAWDYGSSLPGYKDLSDAVGRLVSLRVHDLFREAIADQEQLVAKLRSELFGGADGGA